MLENGHGWKLMARLPQRLNSRRQFDLLINQVNFLDHDFVPMAQDASKALKGIIKLNESPFLDENEVFEWNLVTAQNRIRETLAEDG